MVFLPWKAFAISAPVSPVFVNTLTVFIFSLSTYALIILRSNYVFCEPAIMK
jgi:hypothetical protein